MILKRNAKITNDKTTQMQAISNFIPQKHPKIKIRHNIANICICNTSVQTMLIIPFSTKKSTKNLLFTQNKICDKL